MHEIGDHVPPREHFVIPRDNVPNKRRKQLREQFMRRHRLKHEPWCKKYMELYNELRENLERLYWDEGYSKKIAKDHAKNESTEDGDQDFNPYRSRGIRADFKKDQGFGRNRQGDNLGKVNQLRDKFEFDREKRMREKDLEIVKAELNALTCATRTTSAPPPGVPTGDCHDAIASNRRIQKKQREPHTSPYVIGIVTGGMNNDRLVNGASSGEGV
ncbi:hypothetical protein F3Y22_tig00111693pilonHSYRG00144 [Hibiscus syriacus]|uniref:Uncharacterized protein n=1 Tax=Hibiscus syriacus TaxID=106335 RepID=A0A6A2XGQ6_HIBSY|nr:hypothetical protein F3Y22_tig00111693pilonHSYRG00144 [Hibiscus syriacus]